MSNDRNEPLEKWQVAIDVDIADGFPQVWDGSGHIWLDYRDWLFEFDGNEPKEDLQAIDISMLGQPKLLDWIKAQLYDGYQEMANPATAGFWWWNLDKLVTGEYPWEQIPDYLKPAAKRFYK